MTMKKKTTTSTKSRAAKSAARFGAFKYKLHTEITNYKLIRVTIKSDKAGKDDLIIAFVATCSDIIDAAKARTTAKVIVQWVEEFLGSPIADATTNELEQAMNLVCRSSDSGDDPFVENQKKTGFKLNSVYFHGLCECNTRFVAFSIVRC